MSGQMKVKSLSISRKTQTSTEKEEPAKLAVIDEDKVQVSNLENVLNSPVAHPPRLCSTPVRKNAELTEDSLEQDFCGSPISMYPCTQESGNEIAWDWQCTTKRQNGSPKVDRTDKNNGLLNNTPKRRQLLQKKRLAKSNSPLLNISLKRKQLDSGEGIGRFTEELQALVDKLKSEREDEAQKNDKVIKGTDSTSRDDTPEIYNMKTQIVNENEKELDIHEVTTLRMDIPVKLLKGNTDSENLDASLDDLFDDSIDACMVQCSQEIEDKLRIHSKLTENAELLTTSNDKDKSKRQNGDVGIKSHVHIESTGHCSKAQKSANVKNISSCNKSVIEDEIPVSQIPDDSLDDCLALCLEDDHELLSKAVGNKSVNDTLRGSNITTKLKSESKGLNSSRSEPSARVNSTSSISSKINFKSSSRTDNQLLETSPHFKRKQQCLGSDDTPVTQNRKFFKIKSLSDSCFGNTGAGQIEHFNSNLGMNNPTQISKSTSTYNLNVKSKANDVFSVPSLNSSVSAAGSKTNLLSHGSAHEQLHNNHVSYSYLRNKNNSVMLNTSTGKCNQYMSSERETEKSGRVKNPKAVALPNSQLPQCTPEEIERKRVEAKMRLEANKLKKQIHCVKSKIRISSDDKRPIVKRLTDNR